ncbi:MAG: hypothetical protein QNJ45_13430 [Ardenticatenaceae bacterium]|nr:hypothetical protein [Ardenticatenaceae bacterium]
MDTKVTWLVDERIIFVKMVGNIIDLHIEQVDQQVMRMLASADGRHPIHMIVDNRHRTGSPNIRALLSARMFSHERFGLFVNIGSRNPLASFIGNFVAKMLNKQYIQKNTFAEAAELIASTDPGLPDILPLLEESGNPYV